MPHEYLRRRILHKAGVHDINTFNKADARKSMAKFYGEDGVLAEVVEHAKARKLMGAFRYEQKQSDGMSYDEKARLGLAETYIDRAKKKMALYEQTGNLEFIVDLFNYTLLEYAEPYHPNAHFVSTEREEEI